MKVFILSPDSQGRIDPPVFDLLRQIPERTMGIHDADVVVVPVTRLPDFKFNPALNDLKKPWVLVDFWEQGWNWSAKTSVQFGRNFMQHGSSEDIENPEWRKFDDFVRQKPPIMRFQRELLEQDRDDKTQPVEYVSHLTDYGMSTKDEFKARQMDCLYNWGRSSEYRMALHGAIFQFAGKFGYEVISEWNHIPLVTARSKKWASVHVPHYARIDVKEVQKHNLQSKIGIVMNGCGKKVFRTGEICQDLVMAIQSDNLAWSIPWTDGHNCLRLNIDSMESSQYEAAIKKICNAVMNIDWLYEIYCNAMATAREYHFETYLRRQIVAKIEKQF